MEGRRQVANASLKKRRHPDAALGLQTENSLHFKLAKQTQEVCCREGKEKRETKRSTRVGDLEGLGGIRREERGGGCRGRAEISSWISLLDILPQFSENSIFRACQGRHNPPPREEAERWGRWAEGSFCLKDILNFGGRLAPDLGPPAFPREL